MISRVLNTLAAAAILTFAATSAYASKEAPVIGFSTDGLRMEYWTHDHDYFAEPAKKLGATVNMQSANAGEAKQIVQIENLITQNVGALVVVPFNSKVLGNAIASAKEKGTKVVSYDRLILNAGIDGYTTFDNMKVDELQVQGVVKLAPKGNYFLLGGIATDNSARLPREDQMKMFKPYVDKGDIKTVGEQWTPRWDPSKAQNTIKNALTTNNNNIQGIVAFNDGTAGGAIQVLARQKLAGKVPVSDQDADLAAVKRVAEGTQAMTMCKPIKQIVAIAAEMAVDLVKGTASKFNTKLNSGRKDADTVLLTPTPLTKDNLDSTIVKDGSYTHQQIFDKQAVDAVVGRSQQENAMSSNGTLFEIHNIVKSFSGMRTLGDVSLVVRPGKCAGLCGENGAGKSTLMKVLSGVYPYGIFEGEILWKGEPLRAHSVRDSERVGIVIIHRELMVVQQLSVTENIFLGNETTKPGGRMDHNAMHAKVEELLAHLRLIDANVAAPVMNYGSGYQQLFEIAKALAKNARLLILDEPISSLSAKEIEVLLSIIDDLKRGDVACVYISHKFDEVKCVCDTVTVIRDGRYIGTRPAADMTIDNIIMMMVGHEMTSLLPKVEYTVGDMVMETRNVTCWDVTNPDRKRIDNASFTARRGEILDVAGFVGTGRTEMVLVLFGAYPGHSSAEIIMDGKPVKVTSPVGVIAASICLVPEDRKRYGIVPLTAVGENITFATLTQYARGLRMDKGAELTTTDREVKRLCIKIASLALAIVSLSDDNQQKVVVTKMMLAMSKVPVLNEPTHGVDVGSKYDIYKMIADLTVSDVAITTVPFEMPEILGMSNCVLIMGEGQLRGSFANQGLTQERILAAAINAEPGRQAA